MDSFIPFRFLICLLLVTGFLACDRIGNDLAPTIATTDSDEADFYTFPTEPINIDLKSFADLKSATTFTITKRPQLGLATFSAEGLLVYTPNADFTAGDDQFSLKPTEAGVSDKVFRVTMATDSSLIPCNAGSLPDNITTPVNTPVSVDVLQNDRFCSAVIDLSSLAVQRAPKHGKVTISGSKTTYTPDPNYVGYDEFLYKITATVKQTRTYIATVKVIVGDIYKDCQIKLNDDQVSMRPRFVTDTILIAPLLNDQLCQPTRTIPLTIAKAPAHGKVVVQKNQYLIYRPNEGYTGTDELVYQRCDGTCQQATVTITIKAPDASCKLTAVDDSFKYSLSKPPADFKTGTALLSLLGNDQICAPIASVRISENPLGLKLSISNAGVVSYTIDKTPKVGQYTFSYELTDTQANKSSATVTVTITE